MKGKTKILYIDDEEINLTVFEANFFNKYKVYLASNGQDGLNILADNQDIKVVVSDMRMPEMSGIELIKIAKAKYPEIKYCILSGYEITDEIEEALKTNLIFEYFQKPFKVKEIDDAIIKAVAG